MLRLMMEKKKNGILWKILSVSPEPLSPISNLSGSQKLKILYLWCNQTINLQTVFDSNHNNIYICIHFLQINSLIFTSYVNRMHTMNNCSHLVKIVPWLGNESIHLLLCPASLIHKNSQKCKLICANVVCAPQDVTSDHKMFL